jgi:hypothetical protein
MISISSARCWCIERSNILERYSPNDILAWEQIFLGLSSRQELTIYAQSDSRCHRATLGKGFIRIFDRNVHLGKLTAPKKYILKISYFKVHQMTQRS